MGQERQKRCSVKGYEPLLFSGALKRQRSTLTKMMSFVMKLGTKLNNHMLHTSFNRSKQDVNFSLVSLCQILSISTIMLVTTMGLLLFATSVKLKLKQCLVAPQNFAKCSQLHVQLHWGANQFCNHECNYVLCKWYGLDKSKMKNRVC